MSEIQAPTNVATPASEGSQPVEAVSDVAAPTPEVKAEEDPKFATRFAALTRREKMIQEREARMKAEEAEYKAWKKSKDEAKINPVGLLETHGLSFNELTDYLLTKGEQKQLTAEEKIELLQKRIDDKEKAEAEALAKRRQDEIENLVTEHKNKIKELVDSSGDTYELIQAQEAYDLVFSVMEEHWQGTYNEKTGTGEIMPTAQACKAVEEYLTDQVREKILKLKKFSSRGEEVGAEPVKGVEESKTNIPPTLTNRIATQSVHSDGPKVKMSDEESIKRAAALLRWK
jgi:hypothetical protein